MATRKSPAQEGVVEFFVSPSGNDRWSGRLAAPNARKSDGPFGTVAAAQRAIRRLKGQKPLDRPVRVYLRGGRYELEVPLAFTSRDSGTPLNKTWHGQLVMPWAPVTYCAYRNEKPVLSGGRRITGFKAEKLNGRTVWVAAIPEVKRGEWSFRQLWVNGARRARTRLPREGFFTVDRLVEGDENKENPWGKGQSRFFYKPGDLRQWHNLSDVELVVYSFWIDSHAWLKEVDEAKCLVTLDRTTRTNLGGEWGEQGARYVVENVFEALDTPGQWYLDRPSGKLYNLPLPGERIASAEVIAPVLDRIATFEGESLEEKPVEEIQFEGIAFAHTEWQMPPEMSASAQAAHEVPAAVSLKNARNIGFKHCTIAHVGTYGIECTAATRDVTISCCRIVDLGAGGVKVWHGCRRTHITDNEIGDGGHIFHAACGVLIGQASGNRVLHNRIHNFDYTGVSVGWLWGYRESDGYGNLVEWNHIHNIGRGKLSDLGGIYTLGVAPGTRLRFNLIHDCYSRGYGGWGIYPDEGSSYLLIENNVVYNTKTGGFHQHYGRENIVRNNIFAYAATGQLVRSRLEEHVSFLFERNIVVFDQGELWQGNWSDERAVLRDNIYFNEKGGAILFPPKNPKAKRKATFRQWQQRGLDAGSRITDPKFVNARKLDFRLKKDSPVLKLGFIPFDLSAVGPRKERWEDSYSPNSS